MRRFVEERVPEQVSVGVWIVDLLLFTPYGVLTWLFVLTASLTLLVPQDLWWFCVAVPAGVMVFVSLVFTLFFAMFRNK